MFYIQKVGVGLIFVIIGIVFATETDVGPCNTSGDDELSDIRCATTKLPVDVAPDSERTTKQSFLATGASHKPLYVETLEKVYIITGAVAAAVILAAVVLCAVIIVKKSRRRRQTRKPRIPDFTPTRAFSITDSKTYGNMEFPHIIGTPIGPGKVLACTDGSKVVEPVHKDLQIRSSEKKGAPFSAGIFTS